MTSRFIDKQTRLSLEAKQPILKKAKVSIDKFFSDQDSLRENLSILFLASAL